MSFSSKKILDNFQAAYKFRAQNEELVTKGEFIPLKTDDEKIFAFCIKGSGEKIIAIGNLDFEKAKKQFSIKIKTDKNRF